MADDKPQKPKFTEVKKCPTNKKVEYGVASVAKEAITEEAVNNLNKLQKQEISERKRMWHSGKSLMSVEQRRHANALIVLKQVITVAPASS
jgi:hypothetical protein